MKTKTFYLAIIIIATIMTSCSKYSGFKESDTGLFYKFHVQNDDAQKAELGDVMTVKMSYCIQKNDSMLFTSDSLPEPSKLMLMKPDYNGDISEGLAMMAVGDSASFIVSADSFYFKNVGLKTLPEFIKAGTMLKFNVKLISIQKKADYEKEMKLKQEKYAAMLEELKAKEPETIKEYIKENKITAKPSATGLYYIETTKGTGVKPVKGQTVTVNYTGKFLDGTIFDSSEGREPIKFVIGNNEVIPGWEEGILLMKAGGKAKFIIPSELAYSSRGAGGLIKPYTPLLFEVELVTVK
ncbi:MAG TPA: FKBP-type peptidyl-prolyl cis-trans isomerase [Bacteroidales bacterium]|nr:FKBP-type peptidyl-prolyl cis-trans isomerase [Bacteroidales bacterium]HPS18303.1 FKBP-type peptidyl-prolyl cis-trans isomerase [Bacteroidales bacterium]